jgi:hypothetical protein
MRQRLLLALDCIDGQSLAGAILPVRTALIPQHQTDRVVNCDAVSSLKVTARSEFRL